MSRSKDSVNVHPSLLHRRPEFQRLTRTLVAVEALALGQRGAPTGGQCALHAALRAQLAARAWRERRRSPCSIPGADADEQPASAASRATAACAPAPAPPTTHGRPRNRRPVSPVETSSALVRTPSLPQQACPRRRPLSATVGSGTPWGMHHMFLAQRRCDYGIRHRSVAHLQAGRTGSRFRRVEWQRKTKSSGRAAGGKWRRFAPRLRMQLGARRGRAGFRRAAHRADRPRTGHGLADASAGTDRRRSLRPMPRRLAHRPCRVRERSRGHPDHACGHRRWHDVLRQRLGLPRRRQRNRDG